MKSRGESLTHPPATFKLNRSRRIWSILGSIFMLLAAMSAAHAQAFVWDNAVEYDSGGWNPSVAINGQTAVEVHNGQNGSGPLLYHVANVTGSPINWGPGYRYDSGYNPSVAISGSTAIEVHNGQNGFGSMFYRVGQISGSTINWALCFKKGCNDYDKGSNPSVAVYGNTVVEVHNGQNGSMWYHVGQFNGGITWGPAYYYDVGYNPSIAIQPCAAFVPNCQGLTIIEVHNGQPEAGGLWYHVGTWTSGSTIDWGPANNYDWGWQPKVAFYDFPCIPGSSILEVHNGNNTAGDMWYHAGTWTGGTTLNLGAAIDYDWGWNPSVASSAVVPGRWPLRLKSTMGRTGLAQCGTTLASPSA